MPDKLGSHPVGVFDSGIGGLTVWREIARLLPNRDLVYYGDQAHCPYGSRPPAEICKLTRRAVEILARQGAEVIVVACNTASAAALDYLRREFPAVSFVGMEPAIKPAAAASRMRRIGLLATRATLGGNLLARTRDRWAHDMEVIPATPEGLVDRIEAGDTDSPETEAIVRAAVQPLCAAGVDVIVLGCTHYPFVAPLIRKIAGEGVAILDPSPAVARQVARILARDTPPQPPSLKAQGEGEGERAGNLEAKGDTGAPHYRFITSGDPVHMAGVMEKLLGTRNLVLSDSMV